MQWEGGGGVTTLLLAATGGVRESRRRGTVVARVTSYKRQVFWKPHERLPAPRRHLTTPCLTLGLPHSGLTEGARLVSEHICLPQEQ